MTRSMTDTVLPAWAIAVISKGDEAITTPITFAATANAAVYCGGKLVFADIREDTLNIDVREIARRYKQVILHGSREDTARLLALSDVVIILSSTVGIEAALLDKPIICINIANQEPDSIYVSRGVAIEVRKMDQLIPAIKDALYNEEVRTRLAEARKKFVYDQAYIQDGQALKRVADLIIHMIEESRGARIAT